MTPKKTDEIGADRYRCWTDDTDKDKAVSQFRRRYGRKPEEIHKAHGLLWLGPVRLEAVR